MTTSEQCRKVLTLMTVLEDMEIRADVRSEMVIRPEVLPLQPLREVRLWFLKKVDKLYRKRWDACPVMRKKIKTLRQAMTRNAPSGRAESVYDECDYGDSRGVLPGWNRGELIEFITGSDCEDKPKYKPTPQDVAEQEIDKLFEDLWTFTHWTLANHG